MEIKRWGRTISYRDKIVSRSSVNQALHSKGAILNAIKLAHRDTVKAPKTNIFYMVPTAAPKELRAAKRCRTHLRSGKILNAGNPQVVDCQIFDRSKTGSRLRLFANIRLPLKIMLFDDVTEKLTDATVVWRRNRELGICFSLFARPGVLTGAQLASLRAGYNPARH